MDKELAEETTVDWRVCVCVQWEVRSFLVAPRSGAGSAVSLSGLVFSYLAVPEVGEQIMY